MEDRPPRCMPAPPQPRINNPSVPFSPGESEQDSPDAYKRDIKAIEAYAEAVRKDPCCVTTRLNLEGAALQGNLNNKG